jgi:hypothetical protein
MTKEKRLSTFEIAASFFNPRNKKVHDLLERGEQVNPVRVMSFTKRRSKVNNRNEMRAYLSILKHKASLREEPINKTYFKNYPE